MGRGKTALSGTHNRDAEYQKAFRAHAVPTGFQPTSCRGKEGEACRRTKAVRQFLLAWQPLREGADQQRVGFKVPICSRVVRPVVKQKGVLSFVRTISVGCELRHGMSLAS